MRLLHFLRTFYSLNRGMKLLLMEAYLELGYARLIKLLPMAKTSNSLGVYMGETTYITNESDEFLLIKISEAIHIMSRHTFWESQCMVKALAGMRMLNKRRIECTIYFGTGKDQYGKMCAHAWLRSGSLYISGAEEMDRFTIVGKFAKTVQ
ncbi:lasso peptide biosynthesis B2 protein [Fictibacillus halophilus]|uniref:lasso peptide biosynthesis B2 protein n=1 Tax=Fictibacillus halophilus TaxID=1610490 RepID=UPI00363C93F1